MYSEKERATERKRELNFTKTKIQYTYKIPEYKFRIPVKQHYQVLPL